MNMARLGAAAIAAFGLLACPADAKKAAPAPQPEPVLTLKQLAADDWSTYFYGGDSPTLNFAMRMLPKRQRYDLDQFEQVSNAIVFARRGGRGIEVRALVDS